jgi:hypothetical protein
MEDALMSSESEAPACSTPKKHCTCGNSRHMTSESADMDAWAAEQNEIVYHNAGVYLRELIDYATERNCDWRTPGSLEQVRRQRDQDAHSALIRRQNHRGGKTPKYDKAAIRAKVRRRHDAHSSSGWLEITAAVARGETPLGEDTPQCVLRFVREYTRDMRW